jgi:heme-degrading monooxygenase HmoA
MLHPSTFVVVWEFLVRPGCEARFEKAYGQEGAWVQLFRTNPHFVRTELQRDLSQRNRYWTLDFWTSEAAYNEFRVAHTSDYERIDGECERLTAAERELGRFTPVS